MDVIRVVDSYASLLVLLLANFLLLELVEDERWGALGSTLLAAAARIVLPSAPHRASSTSSSRKKFASSSTSRLA